MLFWRQICSALHCSSILHTDRSLRSASLTAHVPSRVEDALKLPSRIVVIIRSNSPSWIDLAAVAGFSQIERTTSRIDRADHRPPERSLAGTIRRTIANRERSEKQELPGEFEESVEARAHLRSCAPACLPARARVRQSLFRLIH